MTRILGTCLPLLALLSACGTIGDVLEGMDKPKARVTGVDLRDLSLDGLTLRFDIEVSNPYGVALPLVGLDYALASRGTRFLSGQAESAGSVPANDRKTFPLDARVGFRSLLEVLSGVRPGAVVPWEADIGLSADAPGVGRINLPLRRKGELPVPAVPGVKLERIHWQSLSLQAATAVLHVGLENRNDFPVDLSSMDYRLSLGGTSIVSAALREAKSLGKGRSGTLEIPVSLSPVSLGMGVFNMLRGSDSTYRLAGSMAVGTPFGSLDMPYDQSGRVPFTR